MTGQGGTTIHADWWGGWHAATNQMFLDNCVNHSTSAPSGCGFGYLTDGGPDAANPKPGPALRYREQYTGPSKVPAAEVYAELCPGGKEPTAVAVTAYCNPASGISTTSGGTPSTDEGTFFCPVPSTPTPIDET
jgi:hypothetical protein